MFGLRPARTSRQSPPRIHHRPQGPVQDLPQDPTLPPAGGL